MEVDARYDIIDSTLKGETAAAVSMYVYKAGADVIVTRVKLGVKWQFPIRHGSNPAAVKVYVSAELPCVCDYVITIDSLHNQRRDELSGSR